IRADLIKKTADGLAYTINTQGLPYYVLARFGEEALERGGAIVEWDVTPPKDRNSEASALVTVANAIKQLTEALAVHGMMLDVDTLATRFGVPTKSDSDRVAAAVDELTKVIELARGAGLQPTKASVQKVLARAGLDLEEIPQGAAQPKRLDLAPTDLAKVVKASEARASQALPPFGDERD